MSRDIGRCLRQSCDPGRLVSSGAECTLEAPYALDQFWSNSAVMTCDYE